MKIWPNYVLPRQICVVIFCRECYHAPTSVQTMNLGVLPGQLWRGNLPKRAYYHATKGQKHAGS